MRLYEVRIGNSARSDMEKLRAFLDGMLSLEGAVRYANIMRAEIKMLSILAECHRRTSSKSLKQIHPEARKMISHNRKWMYVYHIEERIAIIDRIIPAKMDKG